MITTIEILEGRKIITLKGRGSYYSPDEITVYDMDDNEYRMNVKEFLKIINDYDFMVVKKRKYKHLEIITKGEE